jgi:cysteine desulfurase/selenocysteine lyase
MGVICEFPCEEELVWLERLARLSRLDRPEPVDSHDPLDSLEPRKALESLDKLNSLEKPDRHDRSGRLDRYSFLSIRSSFSENAMVGSKSVRDIRRDFPILAEEVNGHPLVWLDNAATTQRPRQVIERIAQFYEKENSNVHRGAHTLAQRSTEAYEEARDITARFIGAGQAGNVIFTKGTTEGINLVAHGYVKSLLAPGDEIVVTSLEHHANIVPWQIIAREKGAVIRVAPADESGQIDLDKYALLFNDKTKFASMSYVSNALGTVLPIKKMIAVAHTYGVATCIDGAQAVSHIPIDVTKLDADFFAFSGHKIYGPMGIGVLYGKKELLEKTDVYQGGGNMIRDVTFERTVYNDIPAKFEAGTPHISGAAGLGAAIRYVRDLGMETIARYEHGLLQYAHECLSAVGGLRMIGAPWNRAGVLSFVLDGCDIFETAAYLNDSGIAVRAGHHCAQPILRSMGYEGTVRMSVAFYNTPSEIDYLGVMLQRAVRELKR